MIKNILKNAYRGSKAAIIGILEEYKKDDDIEKLLDSLDKQINIQISNENNNSVNIINNNEIKIDKDFESLQTENKKTISENVTKNEISYYKLNEKYKVKIESIIRSENFISEILDDSINSINGNSYNGHTILKIKQLFLNSIVHNYYSRLLIKLIENKVFDTEEEMELYISFGKENGIIPTPLFKISEKWLNDNIYSHYS